MRTAGIGALALVLAACGEATVSFKRGAMPGNMASDEQACKAAEDFAACMQERGWFVAGRGTDTEVAGRPSPAEEAAGQSWLEKFRAGDETARQEYAQARAAAAAPATVPAAPAPAPAVVGAGTGAAPAAAEPVAVPESPAPKGSAAAERAVAPVAAPAAPVPAKAAAKVFDPLARVRIGSWWKLGGSAAALDADVATCVGELGNAHRPDPALTEVTAGLRACLRAAGWFSLGGG